MHKRGQGEKKYRGWTVLTERCFIQVGKGWSGAYLWECRAFKEGADVEGIQGAESTERAEAPQADVTATVATVAIVATMGNEVEAAVQEILPARSFDEEAAYREACARIDRIEGATREGAGGIEGIEAKAVRAGQIEAGDVDPLYDEYRPSSTPKSYKGTFQVAYRVSSAEANHRHDPRRRSR